ncbi:MAG: hypothetical protein Q9224_005841 [Gallowayella concinna]
MLDYPEQYSFIGLRRNAIKPGEVEHLIKNCNGPLHPPWATSPMRKRKCSTINHHKALESRPEARVQVTQLYDMGLPVLSHDDATAMKTSRHRGTTYLESQPEHPTKVRPAKKRKRASLSEEDEYDDLISSSLDDFHPSEINSGEDYIEEQVAGVHDHFPTQVLLYPIMFRTVGADPWPDPSTLSVHPSISWRPLIRSCFAHGHFVFPSRTVSALTWGGKLTPSIV